MAQTCKASTRCVAVIPDRYSPDFVEHLDRRTKIAKAICLRIESIESDMGDAQALSHARRSLVRRAVWLEAVIEQSEQRLAAGEEIELKGHVRAVNTLRALYGLLGLERRPRPALTLRQVMNGALEPAGAAPGADRAEPAIPAVPPAQSGRGDVEAPS